MTNSASPLMEQKRPIPEPEEKYVRPVFPPSYYIAHMVMIVYILAGIGTQFYQYATHKTYRVLSVATWPWILTGSSWLLLISVLVYGTSLFIIARHVKSKLEEMEITWFTLAPYILFSFILFAMIGRLLIYYISPEGIFFQNFLEGK